MKLPLRRLEEIPEKEETLKIKDYILIKLCAFDLGSTIPGIKIDPAKFCTYLVHKGIAIANEDPLLGIYGDDFYIAKKLGFLEQDIAEKLENPYLSEKELEELHEKIIKSLEMRANADDINRVREKFWKLAALLTKYYDWDNKQIPTYIYRRRFGRIIFKPILIRFKHWDEFKVVEISALIHRSGVGCLTFWFRSAKPKSELGVKDLIEILQDPKKIDIEVAIPIDISEWLEKAKKILELENSKFSMERIMELDEEVNKHRIVNEFGFNYYCFKGSLDSLSWVYTYIICSLCQNYLKVSIRDIFKVGWIWYNLIYILVENIKTPFKDVVLKYPKQVYGILFMDKYYNERPDHLVKYRLVDISISKMWTSMIGTSVMLIIIQDRIWKEITLLEKERFFKFAINDVYYFELLCSLQTILRAYDLLLSELVEDKEPDINRLIRSERNVVIGLEEIYPVRYTPYASVSDWWPLAEERLGIAELKGAVLEKLEMVRNIITRSREERLNDQMLKLNKWMMWWTIIAAFLTGITVLIQILSALV